jgi:hypothetical protein
VGEQATSIFDLVGFFSQMLVCFNLATAISFHSSTQQLGLEHTPFSVSLLKI